MREIVSPKIPNPALRFTIFTRLEILDYPSY